MNPAQQDGPLFFAVEDDQNADIYVVVERDAAWLAFIAGYAAFPEPRREREGWPVLVNKPPGGFAGLRAMLAYATVPNQAAVAR